MSKFNDGYEAGYAGGYQIGFNEGMDYAGQKVKPEPSPSPAKWLEVSVDPKGAGHTYRLRVPGGWLYRTVTYRYPCEHRIMELGEGCYNREDWPSEKEYLRAQEIATQTTVFVPEGA